MGIDMREFVIQFINMFMAVGSVVCATSGLFCMIRYWLRGDALDHVYGYLMAFNALVLGCLATAMYYVVTRGVQ